MRNNNFDTSLDNIEARMKEKKRQSLSIFLTLKSILPFFNQCALKKMYSAIVFDLVRSSFMRP